MSMSRKNGMTIMTELKTWRRRLVPLAMAAAVLPIAACDADVAPVYEVPGTGSLEGLVFFDADRNGLFDPSAGDSVLPGVRVQVRKRGTTETLAGGTATAGANGRFLIASIVPGTHDLVVDTLSAPGVRFCVNPLPIDVFIGERQFQSLSGRIACIVSIEAAEQLVNQVVVIQGIVTSAPGQIRSSYTYLQDETGGVRIFSSALEGKGIAIGDLVEVTGTMLEFSRDMQLGNTVTLGTVQKNVRQPTPAIITTGALAEAGTDPLSPELGILVTIRKAQFATAFGAGGINGRNAWIDDGSGRTQIRFETGTFPAASTAEAQAQLTARYPVGKCYDITGVTGAFNGDGQIFPRTLADIVEVPCS